MVVTACKWVVYWNGVSRYIMPFLSWQQKQRTQTQLQGNKPKKALHSLQYPLILSFSLSLSLSLIFILSLISSYNVIILLPHPTICSLCCNLVLWSIHLTMYMCSQFCILSWWTTITIVSNSLFFVVIVGILRYMKF